MTLGISYSDFKILLIFLLQLDEVVQGLSVLMIVDNGFGDPFIIIFFLGIVEVT